MADSPKPSWRKGSKYGGGAAERSKYWMTKKVDPTKSKRVRHRTRLIVLGMTAIGLMLVFLAAVLRFYWQTPMVVLGVADYAHPCIPPNSFVAEDTGRIESRNLDERRYPSSLVTKEILLDFLAEQLQGPQSWSGRKVLLIYLSAHGAVRDDGMPCLLLSKANPLDSSSWLPVPALLEVLAQKQAIQKVLILDSGKLDSHWSSGILYNGFADRLAEQLKPDTGVHVLLACGSGQRAWCAPELNGSVFGYFVTQALREAGDDKRITLLEFYDYVRRGVCQYVKDYRADLQVPQLIPPVSREKDFVVTYDDRSAAAELRESLASGHGQWRAALDRKHDALRSLWKTYESVTAGSEPERRDPIGLAEAQRRLLRLEQLALSGDAYASAFESQRAEVAAELKQLAERSPAKELAGMRGFSLPLAAQVQGISEPSSEREELTRRWAAAQGWPKNEEGEREAVSLSYLASAEVAWRSLRQRESVGSRSLSEALEWVDKATRPDAEVVEMQFLRLLDAYLDRPSPEGDFSYAMQRAVRQAIEARDRAELPAAPEDERAHYWVQSLVDRADQARRLAEDAMFVGDEPSLQKAQAVLQELVSPQGPCTRAAFQQEEVTKFYAARDRAWAELPYLAEWVVDYEPIKDAVQAGPPIDSLMPSLNQLAAEVSRLAEGLDAAPPGGAADLELGEELNEAYLRVAEASRTLRTAYDTFCRKLIDVRSADSTTLRASHVALQSPLLHSADRGRLFGDKYLAIMFGFERPWMVSTSESLQEADAQDKQKKLAAHWQWLGGLPQHPALEILDRSRLGLPEDVREPELTRPDSPLRWLELQGGAVRSLLAQVPGVARRLEGDANTDLQNPEASDRAKRLDLSKADRLLRAGAVLRATRPWEDVREDPQRRLQAIDRHFQFLWHCQRTLDDFYGPRPQAASASGASPPGNAYFEQVAKAYLQSAQAAFETKIYLHRFQNLEDLLRRRHDAAQSLVVSPQNVTTLENNAAVEHRADLSWKELPAQGELAFAIERTAARGGSVLQPVTDEPSGKEVRRRGYATGPTESVAVRHRIVLDPQAGTAPMPWLARVLFRGHVRQQPFSVESPQAVVVAYAEPEARDDATAVVKGEGSQRGRLLFILDCSGSMRESLEGKQRMTSAKESLDAVLQALLKEEECWVGLTAYGHRSNFRDRDGDRRADVDRDGKLLFDYRGEGPPVHPDEDVQEIVKPGRLTAAQYQLIRDALGTLNYCGQTPLYLSLLRTLSAFPPGFDEEPKHIILITDGVNDQIERQTTYEEVSQKVKELRATGLKNLKVDIVFIDEESARVTSGVPNAGWHIDRLKELSRDTEGVYVNARNTTDLIAALRKALNLVRYSVNPAGSEVREENKFNLGVEWGGRPFTESEPGARLVRIHGSDPERTCPIALEGGEALELRYFTRDNRLEFVDFAKKYSERLRSWPDESIADPVGGGHRYALNALGPSVRPEGNGSYFVDFYLSVQNADRLQFTPRPKLVWAEITPLNRSGQPLSARPFDCFDTDFEPDKPVPVFRFRVRGWPDPSLAAQAELSVWFKFKDDLPASREKLDASGARKALASVKGLEGIALEAWGESVAGTGRYRVTVEQRHERESVQNRASVRCWPRPATITHRSYFFADRLTVRHEFEFAEKQTVELRIVPRDAIRQDAIAVQRLKVDVRY